MTRSEIEEVWGKPGVKCWGHVACWDVSGVARPGNALNTTCGATAMAFREEVKAINRLLRSERKMERAE